MKERADNRRTIQERERKNTEGKSRQLKNHTRKRKEKYMRTGERVSRKTTSEKEKGGNRWIGRGILCIEKSDGRTRETRPGRRERNLNFSICDNSVSLMVCLNLWKRVEAVTVASLTA